MRGRDDTVEIIERFDSKLGVKCVDISGVTSLSVADTFDCGQCFRFENAGEYTEGIAFGRYIRIFQNGEKITLCNCDIADYETIWRALRSPDARPSI